MFIFFNNILKYYNILATAYVIDYERTLCLVFGITLIWSEIFGSGEAYNHYFGNYY